MIQQHARVLLVAVTVAISGLAGCQGNAPQQPPAAAGQAPSSGQENAQATAEAMGDERDSEDFDYMAEADRAGSYEVAQIGRRARIGAGFIERILARRSQIRSRIAARLSAKASIAQRLREAMMAAPETVDENGNRTRIFTFTSERTASVGDASRSQAMTVNATVTMSADGLVVYSKYDMAQARASAGGDRARTLLRTRQVNEDGTATITFQRSRTALDGRTWAANWTNTIGVEGNVTGTGLITRTQVDGTSRTVNLNFAGTVDAVTATTTNAEGAQAEVTLPISGEATAKVGDASVSVTADVVVAN